MEPSYRPTRTIPTGVRDLDHNLVVGGVPRGGLVDFHGDAEGAQATTVLSIITSAQQKGLVCVYVDGGRGMDLAQAREAGVDLDALLVCQPSTVEEALDLSLSLLQTRQVGLLVVDSLALLPLRGQDDPTSHEALRYGSVLMARSLRVIGETASRTGCAVVFSAKSVDRGAELAAIGSNALRFYATLRVEFSLASHGSVARVRKNKLAPLVPTAVRIPRRPARSDEVTAASSLGKMISPSALGSGEPHVVLAP